MELSPTKPGRVAGLTFARKLSPEKLSKVKRDKEENDNLKVSGI